MRCISSGWRVWPSDASARFSVDTSYDKLIGDHPQILEGIDEVNLEAGGSRTRDGRKMHGNLKKLKSSLRDPAIPGSTSRFDTGRPVLTVSSPQATTLRSPPTPPPDDDERSNVTQGHTDAFTLTAMSNLLVSLSS